MQVLSYVLYFIIAIAILLFMVLVHELGHYIAGRILKFKITEFSIGFGKALFQRKNKRGELISLRIFPLGGYCAFKGEEDDLEKPASDSFNAQKPWKRIIVFLAGITMNFLTAVLFSLILLCTVGYDVPQIRSNSVVYNDITYSQPELQEEDVVTHIDGQKIDFAFGETFQTLIANKQAEALEYIEINYGGIENAPDGLLSGYSFEATVNREGETQNVELFFQIVRTYKDDGATLASENCLLCFTYSPYVYSFGEALGRCWLLAIGFAWVVLKALWLLITFQLPISAVGGPISTITMIASATQTNWLNLLILIPAISANLAIFNLLPFPALDGAHVVFTTIEWIRGKPIKRSIENMIHFVGLCILFGFVIIVDILHFLL